MPSTNNLAQYFAQQQQQQINDGSKSTSVTRPSITIPRSSKSSPQSSYNLHSKAVDAVDDDHFEKSTFLLKRTRSHGLLDEFIAPTKKLIEEDQEEHAVSDEDEEHYDIDYDENTSSNTISNRNSYHDNNHHNFNGDNDDDENQFIEDIDDESYNKKQNDQKSTYSYTDDDYSYSSYDNEEETGSMSPSPPETPDLYQPHDDNDIVYEPQRHVDYLSHNWKESDISKSWRYIVLKRKDVANSARLENASWRTWAQAKYNLKTISPESVNWLKDSDVTWLYGPLYKEPRHSEPINNDENNNDDEKKYGSDSESTIKSRISLKQPGTAEQKQKIKGPKPILKKRTVSEMLSQPSMIKLPSNRHRGGHSPIIESGHHQGLPSPPQIEDDFDVISSKINAQYKKHPLEQQQDLQFQHQLQAQEVQAKLQETTQHQCENHDQQQQSLPGSDPSLESIPNKEDLQNRTATASPVPSLQQQEPSQQPPKRHIHFNDRVEQCIALNIQDSDEEEGEYEGDEEGDDINESDSDDEDEGGFFLQVKSPSTPQIHNKEFLLPLSTDEENCSKKFGEHQISRYQTIELLPCTTLKHGSDEEYGDSDEDEVITDKYAVSHNVNTSRGFNYYYDYNSVYPSDQNLIPHVHLGDNEYEMDANTQHLEGVKMVDVPENIILGSNVEIEDTPNFANPASEHESSGSPIKDHEKQPTQLLKPEGGSKTSGGSFVLHSDSEDSEEEKEEEQQQPPRVISPSPSIGSINSKNFGENLTRVSSSPSYASLSDVAAQGIISQSPGTKNSNSLSDAISQKYSPTSKNNEDDDQITSEIDGKDVNELQKKFGNLNPTEEKSGFKHTFLKSFKRG